MDCSLYNKAKRSWIAGFDTSTKSYYFYMYHNTLKIIIEPQNALKIYSSWKLNVISKNNKKYILQFLKHDVLVTIFNL